MVSNDLLDSDELRGRIWRGNGGAHSARVALPTGFAALDRYLPGGGWPLGPLIEVFVERYGVGELSLLIPALAALTTRGGSRASQKVGRMDRAAFRAVRARVAAARHRRRRIVARASGRQRLSVDGRASHSLGLDLRRVGLACGRRSCRVAAFAIGGRSSGLLDDSVQADGRPSRALARSSAPRSRAGRLGYSSADRQMPRRMARPRRYRNAVRSSLGATE